MIPHQLPPNASQRLLHRRDLGKDIGAVPVFVDHFLKPANLALNPSQPFDVSRFHFGVDARGLARAGRRLANGASAFRSVR